MGWDILIFKLKVYKKSSKSSNKWVLRRFFVYTLIKISIMQKRMHSYSGKKLIYGEIGAGLLRFDSSISFALPVRFTIAL